MTKPGTPTAWSVAIVLVLTGVIALAFSIRGGDTPDSVEADSTASAGRG